MFPKIECAILIVPAIPPWTLYSEETIIALHIAIRYPGSASSTALSFTASNDGDDLVRHEEGDVQ